MTPTDPVPETVMANFKINWHGHTLEAAIPVPAGPNRPRVLLPMIQEFANALADMGEKTATINGLAVSCKAGCGACCRQLVPVSETEARHLRDLIEAMPEPRRTAVRQRFKDTVLQLTAAGLKDRLAEAIQAGSSLDLAQDYFAAGIPCPFLEEESCSIYPDRPLICREYLVMSPAEWCSKPIGGQVLGVPMPGSTFAAFARLDNPTSIGGRTQYIPLPLAPDWADTHPEPPCTETVPELFTRFMTVLTTHKKPSAPFWLEETNPEEKA